MPRVKTDNELARALSRFVNDGCGGNKAEASVRLGVTRPVLYRALSGRVLIATAVRLQRQLGEHGYDGVAPASPETPPNESDISKIALQVLRFVTQAVQQAGESRGEPVDA